MRHLLTLFELSADEIHHLLRETAHLKAAHQRRIHTPILMGRVLALIFEKQSLRTRVSFEAAIAQLGGSSMFLAGGDVGWGVRESIPDMARTVSQYVDGVILRTFSQQLIEDFAAHSGCPVINGLSDRYHPCQALADIFTVREVFGELNGQTIVFVGDGNNVARSLAVCCGKIGLKFILAAPKQHQFDQEFMQAYQKQSFSKKLDQTDDPQQAVKNADVIYTDVWASMGQESEHAARMKRLAPYQVNAKLLNHAPAHTSIMHCLPAKRGEEITADALDSERSVVFQQAANRMHAQKALMQWLLT